MADEQIEKLKEWAKQNGVEPPAPSSALPPPATKRLRERNANKCSFEQRELTLLYERARITASIRIVNDSRFHLAAWLTEVHK